MKPKSFVQISNIIGVISIILLIYWVFIFMTVEIFGLKVFRENLTESFYFSILAILALMFGALILNIMFNLTRIAEKHNADFEKPSKKSRLMPILVIVSFPLIFGFLFLGDFISSKGKESMLKQSAKSIIHDHLFEADKITSYSFSEDWIKNTSSFLELISKKDENFPNIYVITPDTIQGSLFYLSFTSNIFYTDNDSVSLKKSRYIYETNQSERDYLHEVFNGQSEDIYFYSKNGRYELYYPYRKDGKTIVFYFSEFSRYGKVGS